MNPNHLASIEGLTGRRLCSCVQTADGLRVVEVPDEHRDGLLIPVLRVNVGEGSVGFTLRVVLGTTVMNVFAGPWNLAAFHQHVRQACEDWIWRV